jgi:hypothetical protein
VVDGGFDFANPAGSLLVTQGRDAVPRVDEVYDTIGFIPDHQWLSTEALLGGDNEACETPSSEQSQYSARSSRRTASSSSLSSTTTADCGETTQLKQHRDRNRIAARKCRQKAKQNTSKLQERERELNQQNRMLLSFAGSLREEILDLKNEILRHSDCNCSVIQNYIANAARRQMG